MGNDKGKKKVAQIVKTNKTNSGTGQKVSQSKKISSVSDRQGHPPAKFQAQYKGFPSRTQNSHSNSPAILGIPPRYRDLLKKKAEEKKDENS